MKNFVDKKMITGFVIGAIVFGTLGIVAAGLSADEISFKSNHSGWDVKTVKEAVDDLYSSKGNNVDTSNMDSCTSVAKPIIKEGLIPVVIQSNGSVKKVNETDKNWYNYCNSVWANSVILNKEDTYKVGETISEEDIQSYFVWIPKYQYRLWDLGEYSSLTTLSTRKTHQIDIKFSTKDTVDGNPNECTTPMTAGASGNCHIGNFMTHPAFKSLGVDGFWVGKFETGYNGATQTTEAEKDEVDTFKIIIKPNVYSWRGITVGKIFKNSYDYKRKLDSHMMKNTEWGAMAYLSTSKYGYKDEISSGTKRTTAITNNNSAYITGYASTEEPTVGYSASSIAGNRQELTTLGNDGTYTKNYLNTYSQLASTTGNYSGVYDTSSGAWDYVAGYTTGAASGKDLSGITSLYSGFYTDSNYAKYWDKYTTNSSYAYMYNNRILGDGTAEFGPFQSTKDPDGGSRYKSSWNNDLAYFVLSSSPWFRRGGCFTGGFEAGSFAFYYGSGAVDTGSSFRIVLSPTR